MGNNSPSAKIKEGRDAFYGSAKSNCDPIAACPYVITSDNGLNWIKGWEIQYREDLHSSVMSEIECLERSSSVSGLVMFLIQKGIIKE